MERAPNLWAFLFNQWPSLALRKLVEGREGELHWTLAESLASSKADPPTAIEVLVDLAARDRMRASLLAQMKGLAAVVMPVCGIAAFRHRERKWDIGGRSIGLFQAMMPAVVANVMGLPAVTVPLAQTRAGLPAGVQLMGPPYEDEQLLEIAVLLEQARGPWVGALGS
jgi:Asp-tRNA(Asn)/Glu-tRNA(Gln) amidotransferase A subunit family amidase